MRTRPGNSAARLRRDNSWTSVANSFPAARYAGCESASGSQWTSGSRVCTSTGKRRLGVVMNTRRPTRIASRDEPALSLAAADVLDHRVREHDVERAVLEGKVARVALDVANAGVARAKALAVVQAERGDPLRPRVVLLEEVQRAAAVALAEAELVRADVEHGRLRCGLQLVEEEAQLALSRPQGDGVGEPHRA